MIFPALSHMLLPVVIATSLLLMLIRPRGIAEVVWISGGVLLLMALRLIPLNLAAKAVAAGADVYLFLGGMMLLSELARKHGVFDWISSAALKHANGSSMRLFTLVYCAGTLVTIFLSNDATAVVLTPAILAAVRKARVEPLPYLFVCALVANAASFVLPISNPANLVVFQTGMPGLGQWLASFLLPSVLSITATYVVLRLIFARQLRAPMPEAVRQSMEEASLRQDGKLVLAGLAGVIVILLSASAMKQELGLPTCVAAVIIAALLSLKTRSNPLHLLQEISWRTLLLVAGLFVMVDTLEEHGALALAQRGFAWTQQLAPAVGALFAGFVVGITNNLVNNLPLGLLAGASLQASHTQPLLTHAVLIGVDLGPNLSVTGSLATILWLLALQKEKLEVSSWSFLKVGALAMPAALFLALVGAIVMQSFAPVH